MLARPAMIILITHRPQEVHMNLLSKLRRTDNLDEALDILSDEEAAETEAEAKKGRIDFHRRNVRNGPQGKVRYISTGQQRRQAVRDQASKLRKTNRRYRREWIANQLNLAVLRAQLQALGVVPYATDHVATVDQRVAAGQWIVGAFGERDKDGLLVISDTLLEDAIKAALEAHRGQKTSVRRRKVA